MSPSLIEINVGVARPDPESPHRPFLDPVVDRHIPLIFIGDPFLCCWIYRIDATGKIAGRAETSDVVLKVVRESEQPGLLSRAIKVFFNQ